MTDASDPKELRDAVKKEKTREQVAKDGLLATMSTVSGRAWLHSFLLKCAPFRSPFSSDALQMSFNAGEANIGLQLIAEMDEASPDLYLQMMKENK